MTCSLDEPHGGESLELSHVSHSDAQNAQFDSVGAQSSDKAHLVKQSATEKTATSECSDEDDSPYPGI